MHDPIATLSDPNHADTSLGARALADLFGEDVATHEADWVAHAIGRLAATCS